MRITISISLLLLLLRLAERRKQDGSDVWDGLLIAEIKSFIKGVRAYNSSFLGMKGNSTGAAFLTFVGIVFGKRSFFINLTLARYFTIVEDFDLSLHFSLIFIDSLIEDLFYDFLVAFSASDKNVRLHKLDKTLNPI